MSLQFLHMTPKRHQFGHFLRKNYDFSAAIPNLSVKLGVDKGVHTLHIFLSLRLVLEMTFVHNKFLNISDVKIAATAIRTVICRPSHVFFSHKFSIRNRVKVGNIAHMVWIAHFLFTDSAYIAHAFQCINHIVLSDKCQCHEYPYGVTNRPKMTTPSIVWCEGQLLFPEVLTSRC